MAAWRGGWGRPWALAGILLICAAPAAAIEYPVKATYLYKFGPFVEWPPEAFAAPWSAVNLCVAGHDPFGGILEQAVVGQEIHGRPIIVRRLLRVDREDECHILYIGGSEAQSAAEVLEAVRGRPVLTVTDEARNPDATGIIHFVIHDNRVRFMIDDQAAAENGLVISSRVLTLALSVRRRDEGSQ